MTTVKQRVGGTWATLVTGTGDPLIDSRSVKKRVSGSFVDMLLPSDLISDAFDGGSPGSPATNIIDGGSPGTPAINIVDGGTP